MRSMNEGIESGLFQPAGRWQEHWSLPAQRLPIEIFVWNGAHHDRWTSFKYLLRIIYIYGFPYSAISMYAYLRIHSWAATGESWAKQTYRLKYATRLSVIPTKHSAQHAKHTSTAWERKSMSQFDFKGFLAAFRTICTISNRVTMRDPKAMNPKESVDAGPKAESVWCFGCAWKLWESFVPRGRTSVLGPAVQSSTSL